MQTNQPSSAVTAVPAPSSFINGSSTMNGFSAQTFVAAGTNVNGVIIGGTFYLSPGYTNVIDFPAVVMPFMRVAKGVAITFSAITTVVAAGLFTSQVKAGSNVLFTHAYGPLTQADRTLGLNTATSSMYWDIVYVIL